jgi:hypothetical protein
MTTLNGTGVNWAHYPAIDSQWTTLTVHGTALSGNPLPATPEEESPMRGLYEIIVVDPETDTVLHVSEYIIAKDEAGAKLKALRTWDSDRDLDDLDVIVVELGGVRPKRKPTEVKVVTG